MTKVTNSVLIAYGILCIGLGVQAFAFPIAPHKSSMMSILAGGLLGVLSIGSVYLWTSNPRMGRILAIVPAVLALGKFGSDMTKPDAGFYPAGLMVAASVVVIVMLGMGHMMANKDKGAGAAQ